MYFSNIRSVLGLLFFVSIVCNALFSMKQETEEACFGYLKSVKGGLLQQQGLKKTLCYGTISEDSKIFQAFDLIADEKLTSITLPKESQYLVYFECVSNDGFLFGFGGGLSEIFIATKKGEVIWKTRAVSPATQIMSFSSDRKHFIVSTYNPIDGYASIKMFTIGTQKEEKYGADNTIFTSMSVTQNFNYVAITAQKEEKIRIWNPQSHDVTMLEGHTKAVNALSFSSDDRYLLSGSDDTTIKIWDWEKNECLKTFEGHDGPIKAVSWLLSGNYIVSQSDSCIKIWDVKTGKPVQTIDISKMCSERVRTTVMSSSVNQIPMIQCDESGTYLAFQDGSSGEIHIFEKVK